MHLIFKNHCNSYGQVWKYSMLILLMSITGCSLPDTWVYEIRCDEDVDFMYTDNAGIQREIRGLMTIRFKDSIFMSILAENPSDQINRYLKTEIPDSIHFYDPAEIIVKNFGKDHPTIQMIFTDTVTISQENDEFNPETIIGKRASVPCLLRKK